ncbi:MAG TPA: N-acetylmuramoyl-L-alanine amidase, partial [Terriglobales bacterium]
PYRLIIDIHGREPRGPSQVAAAPPAGVAADEYAAKAAPRVAPSNSVTSENTLKSGNKQSTATTNAAPVDPAAKPEQKASSTQSNRAPSPTTQAVAKAQPREVNPRSDGSIATTGLATTASPNAAKPVAANPSQTPPNKAHPAATVASPSEAPVVKNAKGGQDTTAKTSPKSAATIARGNVPDNVADEDLPSPSETGVKGAKKPTAAPTAVTVTQDKDKKSRGNNKKMPAVSASEAPAVHEALPTADGDRSLTRALGLKIGRIVIDAGHGGHDTGTIGPNGLLEKDLVLDVALRLGRLLESRLGADVIYTRDDDTFIPLETRTAIANEHQADLFVSVHANSSQDPSARGVETYYLNFTSNPEALEVAARENAVSEKSIHELQDLVKKITLKEKIEESRELASDVQQSLYTGLSAKSPTLRNRGVKKAPFVVLIGANMPSILAEISFVSNPVDEKKLETPEYRQKIAESLYKGIAKYAGGLSGVKVAARFNKEAGQ